MHDQPEPHPRTGPRAAPWAAASAALGILSAVALGGPPAGRLLLVLVSAVPGLALVAPRVRFSGPVATVSGLGVVVLGVMAEHRAVIHPLPLLAQGDLSILAAGTRTYAPLALVMAGVALVVLGLGWWWRSRAWVIAGLMTTAVLALGLLLAGGAQQVVYPGSLFGVSPVDDRLWVEALVWLLALVTTVVVAARPTSSLPAVPLPAHSPASPAPRAPVAERTATSRRVVQVVTGLVVLGAVGGAAAWWWDGYAPRIVLEDVFADPALAGCVGDMLGSAEETSTSALSDLTSLECTGREVVDLDGIERLDGLDTVDLSGNRLRDLSGLGTLRDLRHVDLSSNAVSDLAPLAPLVELSTLTLSGNQLQDLTPLAGMTRLVDLDVSGNTLTSLVGLGTLTSLQYLVLSENPVADLTEAGRLPLLSELVATDAQIVDLSPMVSSTALTRVTLDRNKIVDPSPLCSSPALTYLAVSGNQIADVSGLSRCPALSELWLGSNPLTDVSPLVGVPTLLGVDLAGSSLPVEGIDALSDRGVYVGGLASGRG